MSDQTDRLQATERDLRDTRAALIRARQRITQLEGELTALAGVVGTGSSTMLLDQPLHDGSETHIRPER